MNCDLIPAEKIMFVDDEPNILDAFERHLHKRFHVQTALGPEKGLELLATAGPYAVIVSDLRMPGMSGVQFLAEAKASSPDSVRIMLTGYADTAAAVAAVNHGNIFRFLHKPCAGEVLYRTLKAAIDQYRLVMAERVLLEQTLRSAIEVLTDILSLSRPELFSQTARLRDCVRHMALRLKCPNAWRFEFAAMLSHVGCITVPPAILSKISAREELVESEQEVFAAHAQVGYNLLIKIPRLEDVAGMVRRQLEVCRDPDEINGGDEVLLGARMLKAAIDLDLLQQAGIRCADAVTRLRERGQYSLRVLDALSDYQQPASAEVREVWVKDLVPGMIADQDVIAPSGLLLLARGQQITPSVVTLLESFRATQGVREPLRVRDLQRARAQNTPAAC